MNKTDAVQVNINARALATVGYHETRLDTRQIYIRERDTVTRPLNTQHDILYLRLTRIGMCCFFT